MDKKFVIKWVTFCGCGALIFSVIAAFMIANRLKNGGENYVSADDLSVVDTVSPVDFASTEDDDTVSEPPAIPPGDEEFVCVTNYISDIRVELKYAAADNFTGERIYDFDKAYLRYGTVKKLLQAQQKLRERGFCLKIWDAFRPVSAQFKLWEICPDPKYVSNPNKKYSSHSRGNTVDVTLVDSHGNEAVMPTGFDDFTALADRDYADIKNQTARENALLLESIMQECGFKPYSGEWWHFSDTDEYDVSKDFTP